MTIIVTATSAKARFLALVEQASNGETVEITKYGRTVAKMVPARGQSALKAKFQGLAATNASDDELFQTGVAWNVSDNGPS